MENDLTFVCISDTHAQKIPVLPKGDVLIHCGDFSTNGTVEEITNFVVWLKEQPFKYKVVIAGNHDLTMDTQSYESYLRARFHRNSQIDYIKLLQSVKENCIFLLNESVTIEGYKIWGSPYSLEFCGWAFQLDPKDAKAFWTQIDNDADIVLTHGPAYGHGDKVDDKYYKGSVGDQELLYRLKEIKPLYHLCGHIHEGHGEDKEDGIKFINCSLLNERYKLSFPPYVFKLPRRKNEIKNILQ